jgi:spermidine synthase
MLRVANVDEYYHWASGNLQRMHAIQIGYSSRNVTMIKELGYQKTPLGDLTLRRRVEPRLQNQEVFEVKLGDEYLMSSLFTESEQQLATLGLSDLEGELDVVVGGLGLGYTAAEVLKNKQVKRLLVIDIFQAVIDWHQAGLVPLGSEITSDKRCELRQGDFFELARTGFDGERKFDAVLLDIDHSPEHFLNPSNESLYSSAGLAAIRNQLKPAGVFALWSNDPASEEFTDHLRATFGSATAHDVEFPNPYTNAVSVNSVYVARKKR